MLVTRPRVWWPVNAAAMPTGLTAEIYAVIPIDATRALYHHLPECNWYFSLWIAGSSVIRSFAPYPLRPFLCERKQTYSTHSAHAKGTSSIL